MMADKPTMEYSRARNAIVMALGERYEQLNLLRKIRAGLFAQIEAIDAALGADDKSHTKLWHDTIVREANEADRKFRTAPPQATP